MFGARKGTQVLDIAHAAHLHLQKGADNHNKAGLAQGDIATYYDNLNSLKIAQWVVQQRAADNLFWASAFLRLQLLPKVRLTAGGSCSILLDSRTLGTLTGSRSAVAAGRIPVETVACKLAEQWRPLGVIIDSTAVTFASWVENYYTFGSSVSNAIAIAESFEDALLSEWGLLIKPSSRSVMSPGPNTHDADLEKWPSHDFTNILGHVITSNTSSWPCFQRTQKQMWASFWSNCVGKQARKLSLKQRCRMLDRSVRPLLFFRNTRWPWTETLAKAQSKLQRRMLVQFLSLERWPCEPLGVFCQRRMRAAATMANLQGDWGREHAKRICSWAEHLERPRNHSSLASILYRWHGADWLEDRRLNPDIGGPLRPGTRAASGFFCVRWDESVLKARSAID